MTVWVEPGTGRPLAAPPPAVSVVRREHYRSKVGIPVSRIEADRAEQLARLKVLRDEVHRPGRRELAAMAAEVRAPDALKVLRSARDSLDRVGALAAMWGRRAGRRERLPSSLARAWDQSFNKYTQAFVEASRLVAAVEAVQPRLTRQELRSLAAQVHRDASRPGRGRLVAASGGSARTPALARSAASGVAAAQAAARARFAREEHRRIANEFYGAARLVAATRDRPAEHRAALMAAANLRTEAAALHPLLGVG